MAWLKNYSTAKPVMRFTTTQAVIRRRGIRRSGRNCMSLFPDAQKVDELDQQHCCSPSLDGAACREPTVEAPSINQKSMFAP